MKYKIYSKSSFPIIQTWSMMKYNLKYDFPSMTFLYFYHILLLRKRIFMKSKEQKVFLPILREIKFTFFC